MSWTEVAGYLLHIANVLYLLSYLVRDILWLRVLTVIAACTLVPVYVVSNLHGAIVWNVVFTAINLFQIVLLLLERRPVRLDVREERLYQLAFRALTPREFVKLLGIGRWEELEPDSSVVERGEELDALRIIYEGEAAVTVDERRVATLGEGRFVGEMAYLTGETTSATVAATTATTCMTWDREALDAFLKKREPIRAALQLVMGTDLANKLRGDASAAGR